MRRLPGAIPVLALLACARLGAETYEGYLGRGLPIRAELKFPGGDGPVRGSYAYLKHGGALSLAGRVEDQALTLRETDARGRTTGTFQLQVARDHGRVWGTWKGRRGADLGVELTRTEPGAEADPLPEADTLRLAKGSSLAEAIDDDLNPEAPAPDPPSLKVVFHHHRILSLDLNLSSMGAYPSWWTDHHIFDLPTRKEIVVWDETREGFHAHLAAKLQAELRKERKEKTDAEWAELISVPEDQVEDRFTVRDLHERAEFSLAEDGLHVSLPHYFGLPHVVQAEDLYLEILVPFEELAPLLKQGSPLLRLLSPGTAPRR